MANNIISLNYDKKIKYFRQINDAQREELLKKVKEQILTKEELSKLIASNSKTVRCLNPDAEKKVFVYFCKNGEETDTPVHFYNENGELIRTYPWSGETVDNNIYYGKDKVHYWSADKGYDDLVSDIVFSELKDMKFTATSNGDIFIESKYSIGYSAINVYDHDGIAKHVSLPSVTPKSLQGFKDAKAVENINEYAKKNKNVNILLPIAAFGDDDLIEFAKSKSYVM